MGSPLRLVTAAIGIATAGVLPVFLTGALAVQMAPEVGFGPAGLGAAVGTSFAASALSSAPLGGAAERMGWARAMRLSGLGLAGLLAAIGLFAESVPILVGLLAGAGIVNAFAQPAVNLFLSRTISPNRQGVVFGVKQSAIPLATLIGGLSVPFVALTIGWRWVFVAGAGIAALALLLVPTSPTSIATEGSAPERRARPPRGALPRLAVATGLGQIAGGALASFLVTSAVAAGLGEGEAGLLLAVGSATGLLVRVMAGWIADRRRASGWKAVAALMAGGSAGLLLLATGEPSLLVIGALLAFGAGWGWPGLFNFAVVRHYSAAPAAATSITQIGVYAGNAIGPAIFGALAHRSFGTAWTVSSIIALLGALVVADTARRLPPRGAET